jgi:hypothetical protein
VSGIYEHRAIKGWKKVPYLVKVAGEQLFFLPAYIQLLNYLILRQAKCLSGTLMQW